MTLKFSISFLIVGLIIGSFISPFQSCNRKPETVTKVEVDTVRSTDTVRQVIESQPDTIRIYDTTGNKVTKKDKKFQEKIDSLQNLNLPLTIYDDTVKLKNGMVLFLESQIRGYREEFDVSYTNIPTVRKTKHTTNTVGHDRSTDINFWLSGGVKYNNSTARIFPEVGLGVNVNNLGMFYDFSPFSPAPHSISIKRRIKIW